MHEAVGRFLGRCSAAANRGLNNDDDISCRIPPSAGDGFTESIIVKFSSESCFEWQVNIAHSRQQTPTF